MKTVKALSQLTHEQLKAVQTFAARQLVIASAGSGKTATMVAKVAHAVHTGRVQPHQVLMLAFNREAARELDQRLQAVNRQAAEGYTGVRASTLHAFALDVVRRSGQRHTQVVPDLLPLALQNLPVHCARFAELWMFFRLFDGVEIRHPDEVSTQRAWRGYVRDHGSSLNGRQGFLTLQNEWVDTPLEQVVANWLYLHQVDYRYRRRARGCLHRWPALGWRRRLLSGRKVFDLKATGQQLACLAYAPDRPNLDHHVLVVTLADLRSGQLFQRLRTLLRPRQSRLPSGRLFHILAAQMGRHIDKSTRSRLQQCVGLARLNRWRSAQFQHRIAEGSQAIQARYFIPLVAYLIAWCHRYGREHGVMDYHNMLERAIRALRAGKFKHGYRLILVDEFQDTSRAGMELLAAMLAQDARCQLFAVGDDWQSIYGFAGAQPDALQNFEKNFGPAQICYLTRTFRFNQYLADLAGCFIQKNPAQWAKTVQAMTAGDADTVTVHHYTDHAHMLAVCGGILRTLATDTQPRDVLLLGRYRHQLPSELAMWQRAFSHLQIRYQTVHAAKGGEADAVILLGLKQGRDGFPAAKAGDVLQMLASHVQDDYPFAEERRLFYVALTRARHEVHLLVDRHQPSSFVQELELSPTMEHPPTFSFSSIMLLVLLAAAAVMFGLYNVFIKLSADHIQAILGAVILQFVAAFLGLGLLLFLKNAQGLSLHASTRGIGMAVAAGVAIGLVEILTFIIYGRGVPVAVGNPLIIGGSVIVTTGLGVWWLRETLSLIPLVAILMIAAGILLLAWNAAKL